MSNVPQPPQVPQPQGYTSTQYEFNDEHNRQISGLATAMKSFASLMYILGLVFGIFLVLTALAAAKADPHRFGNWGFPLVLAAVMLVSVAFGFWTSSASGSFRKIVETRNQDIWYLMNAVGSLRSMFGTLRTMIIVALVLAIVGGVLVAVGLMSGAPTTPTTTG